MKPLPVNWPRGVDAEEQATEEVQQREKLQLLLQLLRSQSSEWMKRNADHGSSISSRTTLLAAVAQSAAGLAQLSSSACATVHVPTCSAFKRLTGDDELVGRPVG